MALLHPQHRPCLVIGPTQATYILPHHHQLAKAQGGGGGPGLPHRGIGVPPPAHMHAVSVAFLPCLSGLHMFTTTFFWLSGRPVRKDKPESVAAGGDEEVREDRASMNKCKA